MIVYTLYEFIGSIHRRRYIDMDIDPSKTIYLRGNVLLKRLIEEWDKQTEYEARSIYYLKDKTLKGLLDKFYKAQEENTLHNHLIF